MFLERQVFLRLEDAWKCARTPTKRCDERGRRKSRRNEETLQVDGDFHHHKVPHPDGAAVLFHPGWSPLWIALLPADSRACAFGLGSGYISP